MEIEVQTPHAQYTYFMPWQQIKINNLFHVLQELCTIQLGAHYTFYFLKVTIIKGTHFSEFRFFAKIK